MPRADLLPSFTTEISEVPSTANPLGLRGGGEGGTTPALGAAVNAVVDALAELSVEHRFQHGPGGLSFGSLVPGPKAGCVGVPAVGKAQRSSAPVLLPYQPETSSRLDSELVEVDRVQLAERAPIDENLPVVVDLEVRNLGHRALPAARQVAEGGARMDAQDPGPAGRLA